MATPILSAPTSRAGKRDDEDDLEELNIQLCNALNNANEKLKTGDEGGNKVDEHSQPALKDPETQSSSPYQPGKYKMPTRNAWYNLFLHEIAIDTLLESQMLALTVGTGIVDAVTFTTFSVFVSKQTGNTLFLALYALENENVRGYERNVVVSFSVFLMGAAVFGHVGHHVKQRRRIWLLLSNLVQTSLIYAAAAIRYWGTRNDRDGQALAILSLLAFSCGGQIALALHVGLPELNTTMITGAVIQLATDRNLFLLHNAGRNRRVLFYLSLLVGCFIGSAATTHVEPALGLLLMAAVKTFVGFSFLFNDGIEKRPVSCEEDGGDSGDAGTQTPITHILWGD